VTVQEFAHLTLLDWVAALESRAPVPAGGALALVTLAGAAALAGKVLRIRQREASAYEGLSRLFLFAAGEDGDSYGAAKREGPAGMFRCLQAGLHHLETAVNLLEALGESFEDLPPGLAADMAASGRLAHAAAQTLLVNLAVNLAEWTRVLPADATHEFTHALSQLRLRLSSL
jgi:formiminotetrahydrofolate cyclodeaminase